MQNLDIKNQARQEVLQKMTKAAQEGNSEMFQLAFEEMCQQIETSVLEQARQLQHETDVTVLASRGVRQLTSKEKDYYQQIITAMRSDNPKQALSNVEVTMPETVIDSVFEDLQTSHPLLSRINFIPVTGLTRMMVNTNGYQTAAWGKLGSKIIQELTSGFKEIDMTQDKLSAFLPVCKDMLDLGPEWLDNYVRQVLTEALANGLEEGIVNGTGKDMPIGMMRQVGDEVSVSGVVYPEKAPVKITKMDNIQLGNAASILSMNEKGQARVVDDLIMLVNPSDYYSKVLPAIQYALPGGGYGTELPFDMDIIQSVGVSKGKAVFGIAKRYFLGAGLGNQGRILYSDDYRFLEDERVYFIKLLANGFAKDNNAFIVLDITNLQPAYYKVETVQNTADVENANLADLRFSGHTLTPEFATATTAYTVTTADASNTITAIPEDATASVTLSMKEKTYENGKRLTWEDGENTVTVNVTDGKTTKAYTITVTYSKDE